MSVVVVAVVVLRSRCRLGCLSLRHVVEISPGSVSAAALGHCRRGGGPCGGRLAWFRCAPACVLGIS